MAPDPIIESSCPSCDMSYTSWDELPEHYACPECFEKFVGEDVYRQHWEKYHRGDLEETIG